MLSHRHQIDRKEQTKEQTLEERFRRGHGHLYRSDEAKRRHKGRNMNALLSTRRGVAVRDSLYVHDCGNLVIGD